MSRRIILVDIGAGLTLAGVLPSVALFADYSAQLKARGGQAPYTYTVTTGAAELAAAGLQLDPATGIISGTASVPGTIAITVRATDLSGAYAERGFSVAVIAEPLSLSGAAPMWTVGTPYSYTYTAAHGVPPYTWSIASGSLPAGLTLNATGEISGTPTAGNAPAWTVRVTDSDGTIVDLRDNATLQLLGDFAAATVGTAYSSDLLINGGDSPYSNPRVTVGALPAGLALSIVGDKLRLSGTPTAAATSNFTAEVDSADGQTAASVQSLEVAGAASDPYWSNVIALVHFDDAIDSMSFIDSTAPGAAGEERWSSSTVGAYAIKTAEDTDAFGGSSAAFPGTGSTLVYASRPKPWFDFQAGNWTLEGFATLASSGDRVLVGKWPTGVGATGESFIVYVTGGKLQFSWGIGSLNTGVPGSQAIPVGERFYWCVQRRGSDIEYRTGLPGGTAVLDPTKPAIGAGAINYKDGVVTLGGIGNGSLLWQGRQDEFRATQGVARYSGDIPVPHSPFPDA